MNVKTPHAEQVVQYLSGGNQQKVVLGKWEMQTWYFSPFPKEYSECDTLYFCEYDLHFCRSRDAVIRFGRLQRSGYKRNALRC